jgi:hypothetical protein
MRQVLSSSQRSNSAVCLMSSHTSMTSLLQE